MKLSKKYFLVAFTALGIQIIFGVNFANAMPCEAELEPWFNDVENYTGDKGNDFYFSLTTYSGTVHQKMKGLEDLKARLYTVAELFTQDNYPNDYSCVEHAKGRALYVSLVDPFKTCIYNTLANNNCDPSVFKNSGSAKNNSNNSSSNQTSSAAPSNSLESYNLQVSQNNKQNYQAIQRAYEQANAGKGKKNNKEAVASECMKNNPSQKTFKNNCNQAINFAYCFSGIVPGSKNENPDTLAEMSCQNGQFGTLTIGAGENIPGSYRGIYMQGLACKSPSQPVGMKYDASEAPTGRCSF